MNNNLEKNAIQEKNIGEEFKVCIAETLAEKKAIYQFRYKVYVEEMAKYKLNLMHHDRELSDAMDEWGILIYVKKNQEVIGTVRINIGKMSDFPEEVAAELSMEEFDNYYAGKESYKVATVMKLMVALEYRSSSVLYLMLSKFYEIYSEKGVQFSFGAGNLHLLRLYEKMGYHRYSKNFTDFGYGLLSPLVMLTDDLNHFRTIRSPFLRLARKKAVVNLQDVEWFHEKFTKNSNIVNSQLITADELWSILTDRLHRLPTEAIEILQDLSTEEAKLFLHSCSSIVQCAPGEVITVQGDVSYSHYILLSGSLKSLTFQNPVKEYTIPGQHFGANGLTEHNNHIEEIVTMTQSEILILTSYAFPKFSNANLDIAHKIIRKMIKMSRNEIVHLK